MRRQLTGYCLLAGISVWLMIPRILLYGQVSPFEPSISGEASQIRERVECFTDRAMYITEEAIGFRAVVFCTGITDTDDWSTVLYVELISAEGTRVAYGKFPIHDQVSAGELFIPPGILSGTYFFRCYTRWMRNRGPLGYSYIPLRIINPENPLLVREVLPEESGFTILPRPTGKDLFEFKSHPSIFRRGDTIHLTLRAGGIHTMEKREGCFSVVPLVARPGVQVQLIPSEGEHQDEEFSVEYLPDLSGISLSGSTIQTGTPDHPLPDVMVHLTIMGDRPDYLTTRSDPLGRFTVSLPDREGTLELFVQAEDPHQKGIEVRIDQEFDRVLMALPARSLSLSEEETAVATAMARKVQLKKIYHDPAVSTEKSIVEPLPFYGSPQFSLNMDDYVLLPSLEEVLYNLVPEVTLFRRNNLPALLIHSENPGISLYPPLIMIDEVPCFDMERFLSVSPSKISRIDVVNDIYVKGDMRFGGIVNLRSREHDMAGIDLPENTFFIDFTGIDPVPVRKEYMTARESHLPDTRNTLLWVPELLLSGASPVEVSFPSPDYPGTYVALFRAVDEKGQPTSVETVFQVY